MVRSYARLALQVSSRLAVPLALLATAFVMVYVGDTLAFALARSLIYIVSFVLVAGAGLALVFRLGRALFGLATLLLAYLAQQAWLLQGLTTPAARAVYLALALIVPINLVLLALLPERGTINRHGAVQLGVIAAEATIMGIIVAIGGGAAFDWVSGKFLPFGIGALPHLSVIVILASVVGALVGAFRSRSAVSAACAGAIVAFAVAAHVPTASYTYSIFTMAAGLMLMIAVLHDAFRVAFRDGQTGLPNRQALDERMQALPRKDTLAMIDVDRFGEFTTERGRELSEHALKMIAARIKHVIGRGNAYRYSEREFVAVLPRTNAATAAPRLEALRENVESYLMALRAPERVKHTRRSRRPGGWKGSDTVSLTISIGYADNSERSAAPSAVLEGAQRALHRAREKGNAVSA